MHFTHEEESVCKEEVQKYQCVKRRSETEETSCQSRNDSEERVVKYSKPLDPRCLPNKLIASVRNQIRNLP